MSGQHRPQLVTRERVNHACPHPWQARRQVPLRYVRCGWCQTKLTPQMLAASEPTAAEWDAALNPAGLIPPVPAHTVEENTP